MKVQKNLRLIIFATAFFLLLIVFFGALYLNWKNNYQDKVYPGVSLGEISLAKLTFSAAEEKIKTETKKIEDRGFKVKNNNKITDISTAVFSFDADLSSPVLSFDYLTTAQTAYGAISERTFFNYLLAFFKISSTKKIKAIYNLDSIKFKDLLNTNLNELNIEPTNAYFMADKNDEIKIMPERLGKEINYDEALNDFKNNLNNLNNSILDIKTKTKYPEIVAADLTGLNGKVKEVIGTENLTLVFQANDATATSSATSSNNLSWTIKPVTLITWLSVSKLNGQTSLSMSNEKIREYLEKNVSQKILIEPILPRFEIKNSKVTSWQSGVAGRELDFEKSLAQINQKFLQKERKIYLITKKSGEADLSPTNDLNINEIIGTGSSNFSGSPSNRIKNIKAGAAALNGLLIKPGEEFSLVKNLGEVNEKTGYFQELVIKGNKTIPEYGGGLCQIGTTLFRAALASGLPITSRQNHSYRVVYYEPAGTDAAVYIPNPDVRFINNTNNYILIQVRIQKNLIYFDFWGTKDGRIASTTTPVVYNIVKPTPTKTIETTDLAPGVKKCTEHAHNGADAYFDYTVTYADNSTNTPIQKRFKSHYIPWQEVCLIGAATSTASTTGPLLNILNIQTNP